MTAHSYLLPRKLAIQRRGVNL